MEYRKLIFPTFLCPTCVLVHYKNPIAEGVLPYTYEEGMGKNLDRPAGFPHPISIRSDPFDTITYQLYCPCFKHAYEMKSSKTNLISTRYREFPEG
jgi:hypothetical protein